MLELLLPTLPLEITQKFLSHLSKGDLLQLRLTCQRLHSAATPKAFSTLQLKGDSPSPENFVNIALSPTLREHIREVSCDPYLEGSYEHDSLPDDTPPIHFMQALDYLRYCRHLRSLHIQFHDVFYEDYPHQTKELRLYILTAIFESLAGTWDYYRPEELRSDWNDDEDLPFEFAHNTSEKMDPILLSTLSISGLLAHQYSQFRNETNTDLFKAVGLTSLKLHITTEVATFDQLQEYDKPDRYDFYNELPATWLSPSVTTSLRELSLTGVDWWGWIPRIDLRAIGGKKGLPNLKVLTLGKFVFSHQYQTEWLPFLGLEELYLEDCAMLYEAHGSLLDNGTAVLGQDDEGDDIIMLKDGYPTPEWWSHSPPIHEYEDIGFSLRWYELLGRWCESMTHLKHFKLTGDDERILPYVSWWGNEWMEKQEESLDEDDIIFWEEIWERDRANLERLASLIHSRTN